MDSEAKQIKQILVLSFWLSFASFAAIRMLALFRCACQQHKANLLVNPLGNSFGVLTPLFGFPLNLLHGKTDAASSEVSGLLNCAIVLNSLFLGLVAASFVTGGLLLLKKSHAGRAQRQR